VPEPDSEGNETAVSNQPFFSAPPSTDAALWLPAPGCGPVRAIGRFFRKYAVFRGRASRSEYWWVWLVLQLFGLATIAMCWSYLVDSIGLAVDAFRWSVEHANEMDALVPDYLVPPSPSALAVAGLVLSSVVGLATLVPTLAVTVRRLHDADLSAVWLIAYFVVPLVTYIMCLLPSKPSGARFDDPTRVPPPVPPPGYPGYPGYAGYPGAPVADPPPAPDAPGPAAPQPPGSAFYAPGSPPYGSKGWASPPSSAVYGQAGTGNAPAPRVPPSPYAPPPAGYAQGPASSANPEDESPGAVPPWAE
jgi:uncharacterized membrane protein YhaH (DUF805 family)